MTGDIADSFHCLFQMIDDCIYIHDVEGRFIAVNHAVVKTYGFDEKHFIGKSPIDFSVPGYNDMGKIRVLWQKCLAGEPQRFEFWSKTAKGDLLAKEVIINAGVYAGEKVIIGVARDISKRKALEESLRKLAENDALTELFNRRVFFEQAEKSVLYCLRYQQPLSALIIDIDHFKAINDQYGHPAGDRVLKTFGKFCANSARKSDIVARVGGEEFALIMPNTTLAQACHWAETFTQALTDLAIEVEGNVLRISASIGVSTLTESVSTVDELIRLADKALYQAKEAGRDCYKVA